jgi:hypothetical protein
MYKEVEQKYNLTCYYATISPPGHLGSTPVPLYFSPFSHTVPLYRYFSFILLFVSYFPPFFSSAFKKLRSPTP